MKIALFVAFASIVLCLSSSSGRAALEDPPRGDPPTIEMIPPSGAVEYRYGTELGSHEIRISLEPSVTLMGGVLRALPLQISIDLSHPEQFPQADVDLIRLWLLQLMSYHRNTFQGIGHDISAIRMTYPVYTEGGAFCDGCSTAGAVVVTVGAGLGYRWLMNGYSGFYAEPKIAVAASIQFFGRLFAALQGSASLGIFTGDESRMTTGEASFKLGVSLDEDATLRLALKGSIQYSSLVRKAPTFLGATFEWDL